MTAARVLNPVVLSELCIRASPAAGRGMHGGGKHLQRIKRDLFGACNSLEVNKIFNEEVEKHQDLAAKKWGFDFRSGSPLTSTNSQYIWERVSYQESHFAPEMYTLTRAAHVRPLDTPSAMDLLMDERSVRENSRSLSDSMETDSSCGDCDSQDECISSATTTTVTFKVPSSIVGRRSTEATFTLNNSPNLRKKQTKITEYMKERKRLAQTPKKVSPSKRMRTSPVNGSPSISHSISSHFTLRPMAHRK